MTLQQIFIEGLTAFLEPYTYLPFSTGAYKKSVEQGDKGIICSYTSYPDGMMVDCFAGFHYPSVEHLISPYTDMSGEYSALPRFTLLINFCHLNAVFPKRRFVKNESETYALLDSVYDALELGIFQWLDRIDQLEFLIHQLNEYSPKASQVYYHALRHLALLHLVQSSQLSKTLDLYNKQIYQDPRLERHIETFKRFLKEALLIS